MSAFGKADCWARVDGGVATIVEALLEVSQEPEQYPREETPYGAVLFGRLVGASKMTADTRAQIMIFMELARTDHVKQYKIGLELALKEFGADGPGSKSKAPKPAEERRILAETGIPWVQQVAGRTVMAMGKVPSSEQIAEMGHEGDPIDTAMFKARLKVKQPWYMDFVNANDAKGLRDFFKKGAKALGYARHSEMAACLNLFVDDLAELTIEEGHPEQFIDYIVEHMDTRRLLPMSRDDPLDALILRRKVLGKKSVGSSQLALDSSSRAIKLEKELQRVTGQMESLRDEVRRGAQGLPPPTPGTYSGNPRPGTANPCYECGEVGHFGRDCPKRKARDEAENRKATELAKLEAEVDKPKKA